MDWPQDVAALAGMLGIPRFSVLGYSSGGAYALACALGMPGRLISGGVLNADGPYDLQENTRGMQWTTLQALLLSRRAPALFRLNLRVLGAAGRISPRMFIAGFKSILDKPDQAYLSQPGTGEALRKTFEESLVKGPRGAQLDMALMVSPWDFNPREISVPVCLWYGEGDKSTSPEMGYYLDRAIPHTSAKFYSDEGHLSLFVHHSEEILRALTGQA